MARAQVSVDGDFNSGGSPSERSKGNQQCVGSDPHKLFQFWVEAICLGYLNIFHILQNVNSESGSGFVFREVPSDVSELKAVAH